MSSTCWVELCVSDFAQSIVWFEQTLGFRVVARDADDYAELSRGKTTIQLAPDKAPYWRSERPHLLPAGQRGSGVEIVLLVEDVEDVYQQAQQAKADIVRELADYPWQMRQFWVRHPDGYLIRPAQRILSVNPAAYKRQIADTFRQKQTPPPIIDELANIKEVAEALVRQRDFLEAATIYEILITTIFEKSHLYSDAEGDEYDEDEDEDDRYDEYDEDDEEDHPEEDGLDEFVKQCIESLGRYLADTRTDGFARQKIITVLFDIYIRDVYAYDNRGFAASASEQLVRYTTSLERDGLMKRLRNLLTDDSEDNVQQEHGKLLLKLGQEALDDETYLRICREAGLTSELIDRLLKLGRIDEAENIAQRTADQELLKLTDLFIQYKHDTVAERLVRARLQVESALPILEWLRHYYQTRGDRIAELDIVGLSFRAQPSLVHYQQLRRLAKQIDLWATTHAQILAFLEQTHNTELLIQIALDDGEIDTALKLLKTGPISEHYNSASSAYYGKAIDLTVARAAEEMRPREAMQIYQQHVERLIAERNRKSYQIASTHLTRIRSLYGQIGEYEAWTQYITMLREQNHTLRALKEEMTKAGL